MNMKKRIFLTGGSGFIGRNIREQLGKKYIIISPSHLELDLIDTVAVAKFLEGNHFDIVIHTANIGGNKVEAAFPNIIGYNLRIFFNIVACSKYFSRMIHLGSGAEYGIQSPIVSVKETDFGKRIPTDDYGFYKYVCSKYIEKADNITNLRIFGIFGKYEEYGFRFISNAICRNIFGLPIIINQNVKFSYTFVEDFVRIIDYFVLHKSKNKFYNIGPAQKVDLVSAANIINHISDQPTEIIIRKQGLNKEYTCNSERLRSELKQFGFTPLGNAVKSLYKWYQPRKTSFNPKELE